MCNCPIPFLAQNDGESIGNLNYSQRQVSILRMCGRENNILSVAILLSVNKKNAITDVWLTASVKKLPTLTLPYCVKNAALVLVPITLVIIYSQRFNQNHPFLNGPKCKTNFWNLSKNFSIWTSTVKPRSHFWNRQPKCNWNPLPNLSGWSIRTVKETEMRVGNVQLSGMKSPEMNTFGYPWFTFGYPQFTFS